MTTKITPQHKVTRAELLCYNRRVTSHAKEILGDFIRMRIDSPQAAEAMTKRLDAIWQAGKDQIFLSKSSRDKGHYNRTLYEADLNLPNLGKTMVLSATAGLLAFQPAVRKIIYTINAIESLNKVIRKTTKTRSSFPTDDAATKLIYLAIRTFEKAGRCVREWVAARNQFDIRYSERLNK